MLKNIEFFNCPDGSVSYQEKGQPIKKFDESCREIVQELLISIRDLYPGALSALSELYTASQRNKPFFEYKMVHRFIRCNFGEYDGISYDIDGMGHFNFEHVGCPMRGECRLEGIVCRPKMQTSLSDRETEVVKLLLNGYDKAAISEELSISPYTVTRHLQNIRSRLGVQSSAQIIAHFRNGLDNGTTDDDEKDSHN